MRNLIEEMLKSTSTLSESEYEKMVHGNNLSLMQYLRAPVDWNVMQYDKHKNHEKAFQQLVEGMEDYLYAMPSPPVVKQKKYMLFYQWLERIIEKYGLDACREDLDYLTAPIKEETGIAIIKALHSSKAKRKKDIAEAVGVTPKSVQTWLRRLSPSLAEGGTAKDDYRIAGQKVYTQINEDRSSKRGERHYKMASTMHPIVMQMNLMQVGTMLQALQVQYNTGNGIASLGLGMDIWAQLSDYGKERIRDHYASKNQDMIDFLDILDDELRRDDTERIFETEREMYMNGDVSIHEQLMYLMKNGTRCNIKLNEAQKNLILKNVIIEVGLDGAFVAMPVTVEKPMDAPIRFIPDDVEYVETI